MGRLLDRAPGLTAVFAMSDVMAVGAVRALRDRGLEVPRDLSVVGFDGVELAEYYNPKLATVKQSQERLAVRGVEILINSIENGGDAVHETAPFELIEGESVRTLSPSMSSKGAVSWTASPPFSMLLMRISTPRTASRSCDCLTVASLGL